MQKTLWSWVGLIVSLGLTPFSQAQWVAFNDHIAGGNTHVNATAWNVYGDAPGNAGLLKDINSGLPVGVNLIITHTAAGGGTSAGAPSPGSPAHNTFNMPVNYIDWGSGTVNHAIQIGAGAVVTHTFTNLNPAKRYIFKGTAVRAGGYDLRWTTFELTGAFSYTNAHTPGGLTAETYPADILPNQVVINTGRNDVNGDMAVWENIDPGPDGSFSVLSKYYTGPIPAGGNAGSTNDTYAYALAALRLEEYLPIPTPVYITTQPQSRTVNEAEPVSFTVLASGNPTPLLQWYQVSQGVTNAIPNATSSTYTIASASPANSGDLFFVVAQNVVSNITYVTNSSAAVLTVVADTTAPSLVSAFGNSGLTNVNLLFSEAITAESATNLANYTVTNSGNGIPVTVTKAVLSANLSNVVLTTSLQNNGATYVVYVSGIKDRSVAANTIIPNTSYSFTAQAAFTPISVGGATPGPTWLGSGDGGDLTGGGGDIGGTTDNFQFVYQSRDGDFDVRVRLNALDFGDPWAKAGLMVRTLPLAANSIYSAVLASPGLNGCFFQSRTSSGGATTTAGSYPVNYPFTWLRLQRNGTTFTGYASMDGRTWVQLGSSVLGVGQTVAVGFALSSHINGVPATAQFREFGDTPAPLPPMPWSMPFEPLGPSTRRTPIAITEIMYKTAETNEPDFIEIYNSNPFFENISRYRISGDIDFTFPANTTIPGGSFIILARNPAEFSTYYGFSSNVFGPFTNSLRNSGTVRLRNHRDDILLEIEYSNQPPWPAGADGTGHSLVLARPSYGEKNPKAWDVSEAYGGSPGRADRAWMGPQRNVMINEFLANSDTQPNYIELYNHSAQSVDISGCILSDRPVLNKFVIPSNTFLPPNGFVVYYETNLNFGLSASGETIYFKTADGNHLLDVVRYEAQGNEVPSGRHPDGAAEFYRLSATTPGTNNSAILINDIVINEIMYAPLSEDSNDEYLELYNQSTNDISLAEWRFVDGIDYRFPTNVSIPANGYLVIAKNTNQLLSKYTSLTRSNTFGNYDGTLANGGERVALARPEVNYALNDLGDLIVETNYVVVEEVTYGTGGNWPKWARGGGSSMELIHPGSNHRLAHNWADSIEDTKSQWSTIEYIGPQGSGSGSDVPNWFEILGLEEGEYLVDNLEVMDSIGTNSVGVRTNILTGDNANFDSSMGGWAHRGTHFRSTWEPDTGENGTGCLHIRTTARGDSIANRSLIQMSRQASGSVTLRARVRWLRGWPEALFRLRGDWAEATGRMGIPNNLGSPGLPNSRSIANAAPAVYEVKHTPVVPAANEAVVVTARAEDADGLNSMVLKWRIDPAQGYSTVAMLDHGTGGDAVSRDGLYSATISAQPAGTLVAFQVVATDTNGLERLFPLQDPSYKNPFECLVRFGDPLIAGGFGTYRQWVTASNVYDWQNRPALSNERIPETFVYGNFRAIYNCGVRWSGSPYHQFTGNPVSANAHYVIDLPQDDQVLGTDTINKVHSPGNGPFDDTTLQREQTAWLIARNMGLPWDYRRYVHMFINGNRRGGTTAMMEDTERPGNDFIESRWPDDSEGNLYKLQPWFEQADGVSQSIGGAANRQWTTLNSYKYVNGAGQSVHFIPRYRHNFLTRAVHGSANEYQPVFDLVTAASTPVLNNDYGAWNKAFGDLVNTEQWVRVFAVEHAVGNWDSVGHRNAQNMYGYKPERGKWQLLIWDFNIVLGSSSGPAGPNFTVGTPSSDDQSLFRYNAQDANMPNFYINNPVHRRAYWRNLKEVASSAMLPSNVDPVMDAKYAAFIANGVNTADPSSIKNFIGTARSSILSLLAGEDSSTFAVTTPSNMIVGTNLVTLSGVAPVEAKDILINGIVYQGMVWTNARSWTLTMRVNEATNRFVIEGVNRYGVTNFSTTMSVVNTGLVVQPEGFVLINEIMASPLDTNSYVEIYNASSNFVFNLSGWQINGLGNYTFPGSSFISNRQYIILAKDRFAFGLAYGTNIPVFDTFDGRLDPDGETLTLIQPGPTTNENVIIDRVRYEGVLPWPPTAGTASYQLIDATKENARVGNWVGGAVWRYFSVTGRPNYTGFRLYPGPNAPTDVYLDDFRLVLGTNINAGTNLFVNEGFETGSLAPWGLNEKVAGSIVTNTEPHSGQYCLHLIATSGENINAALRQSIPTLLGGSNYTLGYWYRSGANINKLTSQFGDVPTSFRVFNTNVAWTSFTPGTTNSAVASMPEFPPLWLNEVQPGNVNTRTNGYGQYAPWVELYNGSPTQVNLSGLYLANNYTTNLTQWAFPTNEVIEPGEFKVIWLDGAESLPGELHANFTIPEATGSVALVRIATIGANTKPQVVDYLNYTGLGATLSYGDYPDGQPFSRQIFFNVTPGGTNDATRGFLVINEWMAQNQAMGTNGIAGRVDPADGDYDDWFEIYNPNPFEVNLRGYFLTDTNANPTQFKVPEGYVIPPYGHLMVWADGETGQNEVTNWGLHVNFQLSRNGEQIGLYDPNTNLLDLISFGLQTVNVSQGRFGDGTTNIIFMPNPTPGSNNIWFVNSPPNLAPLPEQVVYVGQTLIVTNVATDPDIARQMLLWHWGTNRPPGATLNSLTGVLTWTPTSGPTNRLITVWVEDNGLPRLSHTNTYSVSVLLSNEVINTAPVLGTLSNYTVLVGTPISFTVPATDAEVPPQLLTFNLEPGAPAGASLDSASGLFTWTPNSAPSSNQIAVRVVDNGTPALSATNSFRVVVTPLQLSISRLEDPTRVLLNAQVVSGRNYTIGYQGILNPTNAWQALPGYENFPAPGNNLNIEVDVTPTNRFYRIWMP